MLAVSETALKLSGPVDFTTVAGLEIKGLSVIENTDRQKLQVDLSGITKGDSSALALLLSWQRAAVHGEIRLTFTGWSPELTQLATLCNINELFNQS